MTPVHHQSLWRLLNQAGRAIVFGARRSRRNLRIWLAPVVGLMLATCPARTTAADTRDVSRAFDSANKLYEQGRFADAAGAYEGILQEGGGSAAIYFNLGNAFYKSSRMGKALAAYRHAEQFAPRDPDLRANLQFVRNQIQGPTLIQDRWRGWLIKLTLNEWSGLAMIALWTWFTLLAVCQWRPGLRNALRGTLFGIGAVTGALCLCVGTCVYFQYAEHGAVVISPEVVVHNGPLDESPPAFTVHDGAELKVTDEKDAWLQVNSGTSRTGWIRRDQVVLVPSA